MVVRLTVVAVVLSSIFARFVIASDARCQGFPDVLLGHWAYERS